MEYESTPDIGEGENIESDSTEVAATEGTPVEETADAVTWRAEPERVSE